MYSKIKNLISPDYISNLFHHLPTSLKRLLFWLFIKCVILLIIILYMKIGLGPDEAQYWTWSRALDWGYYSKPPGIAWQIWIGTQLFGHNELGVRFLSIVLAFLQSLSVYFLATQANLKQHQAFLCGIIMAFTPIGILGSFFAITDGGLLLCWTGACIVLVSSLSQNKTPNPIHIGIWILFGSLFKWPIYLFWLYYFVCFRYYFPHQRILSITSGLLVSLIGLVPSIWWNISHDGATFRHVLATIQGGSVHQSGSNLPEFFGSQALLISPILFFLLLLGLYHWFCQRKTLSPSLFFSGLVTFSLLGAGIFLSCFQKIQGNWFDFAYPTGILIIVWYAFEKSSSMVSWLYWGIGFSLFLISIFFTIPLFDQVSALSRLSLTHQRNPLKHNLGWDALSSALDNAGYDPDEHFLLSDKYQTSSILSFYSNKQKRAYFLNLQGSRKNQFSYWPSLEQEQQNKKGFFVWTESAPYLKQEWEGKQKFYFDKLKEHFEIVKFIGMSPLIYQKETIVKAAFIFQCEKCKNIQSVNNNYY